MRLLRHGVVGATWVLWCIGCNGNGNSRDAADGIHLDAISVNQAIGVVIWENDEKVSKYKYAVPLIARRDATVRLMWNLDDDFEPRNITAVLTLESDEGSKAFSQTQRITARSNRDVLESTINFIVSGNDIKGDTTLSVELLEDEGTRGAKEPNRTPTAGGIELDAWDDTMTLKVKAFTCWMPCATDSWGEEGQAQPISTKQKMATENFLMNIFPIQTLDITWEEEPFQINACSETAALDDIQRRRAKEEAGPDEYYHCVFRQKYDSFLWGGYAWILGSDPGEPRTSYSVNWWGPKEEMLTNVAHEIGHNHGRNHPWRDDSWQPADAGKTGCRSTWGLGIRPGPYPTEYWYPSMTDPSDVVMPPTPNLESCDYDRQNPTPPVSGDVMSYTFPHWVDPYTYKALAERIRTVSAFSAEKSEDSWRQRRTLFGTFTGDELRWTWGYGALGEEDVIGKDYAQVTTAYGVQKVPIRPRVDSNGQVQGLSLPLPPSAQVAHVAGGDPSWEGQIQGTTDGQTWTLDLSDLTLDP